MFGAHLAAGLAIKAAQPRAPAWAVLTGAFLPDFFWIGFAAIGIEPATDIVFFDDWSHSAAPILLQAALFGALFRSRGRAVALADGAAVASHLLLDWPVHPEPLALYPRAKAHLDGLGWVWGSAPLAWGKTRYWWLQLAIVVPLLGYYVARRQALRLSGQLAAASCLIVLGLHLVF